MKNFSNIDDIEVSFRAYGGAGKKLSVRENDDFFLMKLPERIRQKEKDTSYANSCITEYIACNAIKTLGLEVQDTFLCKYKDNIVVICKDFIGQNERFGSFLDLQNKVENINSEKRGISLERTLEFIDKQDVVNNSDMKKYFWDMFVADALIGNPDRHHNNWGYIFNENTNTCKMSPIFDCGASLYPILSIRDKEDLINNSSEFNKISKNEPVSVYKVDNIRINYFHFLVNNRKNNYPFSGDIADALKRVVPKYNKKAISNMIEEIPYVSNIEKTFYENLLNNRYSLILEKALKNELRYEKNKSFSR